MASVCSFVAALLEICTTATFPSTGIVEDRYLPDDADNARDLVLLHELLIDLLLLAGEHRKTKGLKEERKRFFFFLSSLRCCACKWDTIKRLLVPWKLYSSNEIRRKRGLRCMVFIIDFKTYANYY